MHRGRVVFDIIVLLILFGGQFGPLPLHAKPPDVLQPVPRPAAAAPDQSTMLNALRNMPLTFAETVSQFAGAADFQMQAGSTTIRVMDDAPWLTLLDQANPDFGATPNLRPEPFNHLSTKGFTVLGSVQHAGMPTCLCVG